MKLRVHLTAESAAIATRAQSRYSAARPKTVIRKSPRHRRHESATALFAVAMALQSACTEPPTGVLVTVDTDVPASRSMTLHVSVARGSGAIGTNTALALVRGTNLMFPASFGVTPAHGDPNDEPVTVVLEATVGGDSSGEPAFVLRRAARFAFTPHVTTHITLFLSARCGAGATGCTAASGSACTVSELCSEQGMTCGDQGSCVPIDVSTSPLDGGGIADVAAEIADVPDAIALDAVDAATCSGDLVSCEGACVDLQTDPNHCGACDAPCASGSPCSAGTCQCGTPETGPPDFSHEDAGTIADGSTVVQQAIFARMNHWRAAAGISLFNAPAALETTASDHARFISSNPMATCWPNTFDEVMNGCTGWTGNLLQDRMYAQGYMPTAGGEVVIMGPATPEAMVDAFVVVPPTRHQLFDPRYVDVGSGTAGSNYVFDFGAVGMRATVPPVSLFPPPGLTGFPSSFDPPAGLGLPAPADGFPSGPPISVQLPGGGTVTTHTLLDPQCNSLAVTFVPNDMQWTSTDTFAYFYPNAPLQPASRYTVHVSGMTAGMAFDRTWVFFTR
jgi:hypothetical protein